MPKWDLQCGVCGKVYPNVQFLTLEDRNWWMYHMVCDDPCLGPLQVMPSAPNFTVNGYNAKNHYGTKGDK